MVHEESTHQYLQPVQYGEEVSGYLNTIQCPCLLGIAGLSISACLHITAKGKLAVVIIVDSFLVKELPWTEIGGDDKLARLHLHEEGTEVISGNLMKVCMTILSRSLSQSGNVLLR